MPERFTARAVFDARFSDSARAAWSDAAASAQAQGHAAERAAMQMRAAYRAMESLSRVCVRTTGLAGETPRRSSVEAVPTTTGDAEYTALAPAFESRSECARALTALFDKPFEEIDEMLSRIERHPPGSAVVLGDLREPGPSHGNA